jgi:endoglucanase
MKTITKICLSILVCLSLSPVGAQDAATLIDDFDTGYESGSLTPQWWTYSDDEGSSFAANLDSDVIFNGEASMRLDLGVIEGGYAGVGFDFSLVRDWQEGTGIVFQMRATEAGLPVTLALHLEDETQTSTLSPGVTPFGCDFSAPAGSDLAWTTVTLSWDCFQRLTWVGTEGITEFSPYMISSFEVAFDPDDDQLLNGSIWIDDIRVLSETDLNQAPSFSDVFADLPVVHVSQIGYRPQDEKVFVAIAPVSSFWIVDEATGEQVYTGVPVHQDFDQDAQQDIYRGRFDSLTEPGTYHIVLNTGDESYPFTIADDVYAAPLQLAARAFYLQRSGIAIHDGDVSGVDLEAGHLDPALLWGDQDGEAIDVSGGWYDAGDFGRYIPTAAFAASQLLIGFNANPEFFGDGSLNIPESGNSLPDLLDEIRWELDWMMKMQREDGAVHHKVTTRNFPGMGTLPAEDTDQLYVFEVSSGDTAYFAAVMAQAARTFANYDAEYATMLLEAAERAGAWLAEHPDQVPPGGFQNPPVSEYPMQGGYDFVGVEDVPRLWAAAELFNSTGKAEYESVFTQYFASAPREGNHTMSWANAYPTALYAYLTADGADATTAVEVSEVFRAQAQAIYDVTLMSGYGVALSDEVPGFEYAWGSNQVALAHGLYLMMANELHPNERYNHTALAQIQYILGVNPLAKAYISGIGADPMLHPHHNVSYRMQQAVPGFITEGANSQNTGGDAVLEGLWDMGVPVAMRYSDDWESWASNEPTIDANATFVALLAYWAE